MGKLLRKYCGLLSQQRRSKPRIFSHKRQTQKGRKGAPSNGRPNGDAERQFKKGSGEQLIRSRPLQGRCEGVLQRGVGQDTFR